jgi:tRNA pseudouridine38-40 synthase
MTRFRCTIEYDGTDFVGWQRQTNGRSVQGVIEELIARQFGRSVTVHGAGRTDSGVHARGQVAHFELETVLSADTLKRALNAGLPADVYIRDLSIAHADFHARYSAASRSYRYTIANEPSVLDRRFVYVHHGSIDVDAMRGVLPAFLGMHDFTAFSKHNEGMRNHRCHVFAADWEKAPGRLMFTITANRFLTGMVRALVGGMLMVGRGKWTQDQFRDVLTSRDRARIPMLAPAQGLVLESVSYDRERFEFIRALLARRHEADPASQETPDSPHPQED